MNTFANWIRPTMGWMVFCAGWMLLAVDPCAPSSAEEGFRILSPSVQNGKFQLMVTSIVTRSYSLQAGDSVAGPWEEQSRLPGSGELLIFQAGLLGPVRFYRVASTSLSSILALYPAAPRLAGGAVSLPDATQGSPYEIIISPSASGVPPYALTVSGSLPTGVVVTVTSNQTAQARLRVVSDGRDLPAGQRVEFSVSVGDASGSRVTQDYDLRVIPPPPIIVERFALLKAGEPVEMRFAISNGVPPFTWSIGAGTLPAGLELSADGMLRGVPSADAAELNETGLATNVLQVADSLTDRVTGVHTPRVAAAESQQLVRLSYRLNIHASRPSGPSLGSICLACHGLGFTPDVASPSAEALIDVSSGSGGECGTVRTYVIAGDPGASLVWRKVTNPDCGSRMPLGGPYLSAVQIGRLERWIRELRSDDRD